MKGEEVFKRASAFAEYAHRSVNQLRKYTNEPYIVHPIAVSRLVATVTSSMEVMSAAILHDTIEDVDWVTGELITITFGKRIANLVLEVTDVSKKEDGNRAVRKHIDLMHLANASPEGQTIKLADLIDNTESITKYDPGFAYKYMREKRDLLQVLTRGDLRLYEIASKTVADYFSEHGE
jgi:(p)ppGpp synthase/HD superfamily hydrolase